MSLKILYLANYAPSEADNALVADEGVYPAYHRSMFELLVDFGFDVVPRRTPESLLDRERFDYVFSLLNRAPYRGSEVFVTALCEYLRLPYLGAGPHVRAVADDKHVAKHVARSLGIRTADWVVIRALDDMCRAAPFPGPYFAKPRSGASSRLLGDDCLQDTWTALSEPVARLQRESGEDVLIEAFVPGMNISLPMLGGDPPQCLPAYQALSPHRGGLITYAQKRRLDRTLRRRPVESDALLKAVNTIGVTLYYALRPIDYLRVDVRVTPDGEPVFLEFNVCCNIGPQSGFAASALQEGWSHRELVSRILRFSFGRQQVAW
jgi:D-alanine-D-alanine ligase